MYCDIWPYVLWPLDFQIQKRIVSAETIWGNMVIKIEFEKGSLILHLFLNFGGYCYIHIGMYQSQPGTLWHF